VAADQGNALADLDGQVDALEQQGAADAVVDGVQGDQGHAHIVRGAGPTPYAATPRRRTFARRRPPTTGDRHGQGPGQEEGREEETGEDAEGRARCEEGEESRPLSRLFSVLISVPEVTSRTSGRCAGFGNSGVPTGACSPARSDIHV